MDSFYNIASTVTALIFILFPLLVSSNELRSMLVDSGRDDPILSGINHENDKVFLADPVNGAYMMGRSNASHLSPPMPTHHTASTSNNGVLRMQSRRPSEHIGADGRFKTSICDQPNGFLRKQRALCLQYIQLMESVVRGYFMGLRECEYQFSVHRWNCLGYNLTIGSSAPRRKRGKVLRSSQLSSTQQNRRVKTYMDRLLSSGRYSLFFPIFSTLLALSCKIWLSG